MKPYTVAVVLSLTLYAFLIGTSALYHIEWAPNVAEQTRFETICGVVAGTVDGDLCLDGDVIIFRKGGEIFEDSPYWIPTMDGDRP